MIALGIIIGYLGLLLVLGYFSSRSFRGTTRDYQLASQTIGPVLLLLSLFGTTMTAFALVGSTGEAFVEGVGVYGMLASISGVVHSFCFFVVGVKLWSLGRRLGFSTQTQFFRERLDSEAFGWLLFPVLIALVIPYLLIGVIASGAVIGGVSLGAFEELGWFASTGHGVPPWLGSLVVCLVVLVYVFFGGMRGTAWANAMQTIVFMALGVITFVVIAWGIGDQETLLGSMQAATASANPERLTRAAIDKSVYFSYLLIPLSVAMFPHVFQHWLTARSASTFKLPIVMHPIFVLIVWLPCVLIGVWATSPTANLPPFVQSNPNLVLPVLVRSEAGVVLAGFLSAGILAAIMSSLDSQFLCIGTMFTHDVVLRPGRAGRISEGAKVLLSRLFVVGVVAVTYLVSLAPIMRNVFDLAILCFSGFSGLFPLVFAALYWKRLTLAGATASVVTAIATWGYCFYASEFGHDKQYYFPQFLDRFDIRLMPVVGITVAAAVVLVAVSLVTSAPSAQTLRKFFDDPAETSD